MKKNIKKIITLAAIYLVSCYSLTAQKANETAYKAYLISSEALWKQAIAQSADPWQKAVAHYGLLNNTMITQNEDLFDDYVDPTLDLFEELEEVEKHQANALSLRASVYGFIMGYSPWKGMIYGPKSSSAIEKALELTETSGIVWMVRASSLFYTPESFGGNKIEAEKAFEKSIQQFETAGDTTKNWLYINTLANLGKVYQANSKNEMAIDIYQKALSIEPGFNWVSKVLLPKAQK